MDRIFLKIDIELLMSNEVFNLEGEGVSFSLTDKVVYSYMLMRIGYFCWEKKGEYFDTQDDIAKVLGIDVQPVRRSIKKMIDMGILKGRKIRYDGRIKWVYTDIVPLDELKISCKQKVSSGQKVIDLLEDDFEFPF